MPMLMSNGEVSVRTLSSTKSRVQAGGIPVTVCVALVPSTYCIGYVLTRTPRIILDGMETAKCYGGGTATQDSCVDTILWRPWARS